jgi:hypothetical protein
MQARPVQTDFFRIGALSTLVGGALAIVFNLLHPRSSGALSDAREELELVANSDIWRFDHLMLGLAVVLIYLGVIAISMSMWSSTGEAWARAWLIFGAVSTALLLVLLALDGSAIKHLADEWVAGGSQQGGLAAASVLVGINASLLEASVALSFGITPLLFGMAILGGDRYPKAVGQMSVAAGAVGLFTATWFAVDGISNVPLNFLFPLASLLYTIAIMWAAWELFNSGTTPTVRREKKSMTRAETPITPGL